MGESGCGRGWEPPPNWKDENNNELQSHAEQRSSLLPPSSKESEKEEKVVPELQGKSEEDLGYRKKLGSGIIRKLVVGQNKWTSAVLVLVVILSLVIHNASAVCVWQGGQGFRLACGFRQSGLFRIRSFGGLKGYIGAGFTVGDEDGFKDSLTNTEPIGNQQKYQAHGQQPVYHNSYQRVGEEAGVPLSLEELKRREQLRYLQQIQTEQMLEHQVLQQQASMQKQQKATFQARRLPLPQMQMHSPNPPQEGRGGGMVLTKRASPWRSRWPFGRGNGNGKPQPPPQGRRMGPPPPQGRRGPPPSPPQSRVPPPAQRRTPFQGQGQGPRRVPGPSPHPYPQQRVGPSGPPPPPPQGQFQFNQQNMRRQGAPVNYNQFQGIEDDLDVLEELEDPVPNQLMIPPSASSGFNQQYGQFEGKEMSHEDIAHLQFPDQVPNQPQFQSMNHNQHSQSQLYYPAQGQGQGQRSHHTNYEVPSTQIVRQPLEEDEGIYLSGMGNLDKDALATAVYDPNIFPDIYFTTTERGSKLPSPILAENEEDLHKFDTAALHTNENVDRMDKEDGFPEAPPMPRKKLRRRRKKFRILKKKGEVASDVKQELDTIDGQEQDPLSATMEEPSHPISTGENETERGTKLRRRKKGRRRKRPKVKVIDSHPNSSEKVREAVSSRREHEELPISGPSPLTLTLSTKPPKRKSTTTTTTTTTTPTPTTTTTTTPKIEMATFGYFEALDRKKGKEGNKEVQNPSVKYHHEYDPYEQQEPNNAPIQQEYDPRFPPDHDVNRGRIPAKFVRKFETPQFESPKQFGSGGLNVLDPNDFNYHVQQSTPHTVKFSPSTDPSSSFVKFDSRESIKSIEKTRHYNDRFYSTNGSSNGGNGNNNFGPTGFYDVVPPNFSREVSLKGSYSVPFPNPSQQNEVVLPWESRSTTAKSLPTWDHYGVTSPSPKVDFKKTIFSGEDHAHNWEAPNFWGSIQNVDRYEPSSDFVTNDNFKRVMSQAPPEPPSFGGGERSEKYPTYFESTTINSIHKGEEEEERWKAPSRNHHNGYDYDEENLNAPTPAPSPPPFYIRSSTPPGDDGDFGKLEQLPVQEMDIDNFGITNNFNFISSTSTTTAMPAVINGIRGLSKNKKRKQKRPEVKIKIKGEHQPEEKTQKSETPTPSPTPFLIEKGSDNDNSYNFNGNDKLRDHDDSATKATFSVGQSAIHFGSTSPKSIAETGFDGNFVPSSSPFLKDSNPFDFEQVIPKNPFSSVNNQFSYVAGPSEKSGDVSGDGEMPKNKLQHRESSEERRTFVNPPNENGSPQYGFESRPTEPTHRNYEEGLPNIVPSPPDPVLTSEVITISGNNHHLPQEIPVFNLPQNQEFGGNGHGNHGPLRWEEVNLQGQGQEFPRKQIQILNIQNNVPQPPQEQKKNDFMAQFPFKSFPNYGQAQQAENQEQGNRSPSIKLVRPAEDKNMMQMQVPRPHIPQDMNMNVYPGNLQSVQFHGQKPDLQQPYQIIQMPAGFPVPIPTSKNQLMKNGPPKKYNPVEMNLHNLMKNGRNENKNNNIPLPHNPYIPNQKKAPPPTPTKIPAQRFQPPPAPTQPPKPSGSFLSRFNPFGRGPSSSGSGSQNQNQQKSQAQSQSANSNVNPFNTRFQAPPPPPPPGKGKGVEVTYVDLDDRLNSHPRLVPPNMGVPPSPNRRPQPPHPTPRPTRPLSEKEKVLQAIATLNNIKYDVIQSVAEEQFGSEILDRIKAKKAQAAGTTTTTTTPRPILMPILTTLAPMAGSLFNIMGQGVSGLSKLQQQMIPTESQRMSPTAISNLLNSFGGYGDSQLKRGPPVPPKSPTMSVSEMSTDAITNLFNSLTSGEVKPKPTVPTTTTTTAKPIMVSLDSLTGPVSIFGGLSRSSGEVRTGQDIKALQAQLAKAILAKAGRKGQEGPSSSSQNNAFGLVNSLAQSKNYTQNQISTLKKLIALNNIEQKLNSQLGLEQTTPKHLGVGPTIKSLLNPSGPSMNSLFSNKMLRDSEQSINSVQNSGKLGDAGLHNDPTLLALKALALKKAHSIQQQQPQVEVNKRKEEGSDFRPIPVDLSAILSPSPPLEEPRKRRLTDVRNAPKSFYPANATLGFDSAGSGPGSSLTTEFDCEGQSFFPGLYADTGLGCKVFHLCAKTDAGYLMKSFRCPKETVFDQEVLKCNWSLFVECGGAESKYHFNKYLSQSFQFLKVLGEFSKNVTAING